MLSAFVFALSRSIFLITDEAYGTDKGGVGAAGFVCAQPQVEVAGSGAGNLPDEALFAAHGAGLRGVRGQS